MPCKMGCPNEAISKNEYGGVVVDQSKCGDCDMGCVQYCPYEIPKPEVSADGVDYCRVFKCRLCPDRIEAGKSPACAATCPTGAIGYGDKDAMVTAAEARVEALKAGGYADAAIYPGTDGNAMWILLAGNDAYELADYKERVTPETQTEEPRPMLASRGIGAAALVGALAVGALKALGDRKEMVASLEDEEE